MKREYYRFTIYVCMSCLLILIMTGCRLKEADSGKNSSEEYVAESTDEFYPVATEVPKEAATEAESVPESDTPFSIEEEVAYMFSGDSWKIPYQSLDKGIEISPASLSWTSSDPDTVSVDMEGNVRALQEGNAVITCKNLSAEENICINVYDEFGGGDYWDLPVRTGDSGTRVYRNYDQGAYRYGEYSEYVWMHGCAVCCTATTIGAWYPEEEWSPDQVISQLEPKANETAWEKNYTKSLSKQMPLTLKGISRVLDLKEIPHVYITSFDKETVAEDLAQHLNKGYPVIYEAGNGGYHMMMLLGIMTNGDVILSDSVGFDRVGAVPMDMVIRQMFSCKKEPEASYFSGRKTAGGYIKVGAE